jgi:hypothetical protein
MPIVITKSIFRMKNVTETERGQGVKIHMLFNTLYSFHQQLHSLNLPSTLLVSFWNLCIVIWIQS